MEQIYQDNPTKYEFLKNVYDLGTFMEDLPGRKLVGLLLSGPTDLNSLYKQIM